MPFERMLSSKLVVFKPDNFDAAKKYPLFLFLHGMGERGDGSFNSLGSVEGFLSSEWNGYAENCNALGIIIVAPQLSSTKGDWDIETVDAGWNYAKASLNANIDWTKTIISGVSLGGGGVWRYLSASVANASKFACAIVCCGVGGWSILSNIAAGKVAVWAFHAANDGQVGAGFTHSAVDGINAASPLVPAKKTIYPDGGHFIWSRVYDTPLPGIEGETVSVWQYMLMNSVGKPVPVPKSGTPTPLPIPTTPTNMNLIAAAGMDQNVTILQGKNSATIWLQGSGSYVQGGGTIDKYLWEQVTGPNTATIKQISGSNVEASGLVAGTYGFRLTVTSVTTTATDDVLVIVSGGSTQSPTPTTTTKKVWAQVTTKSGKQHILYDDDSSENK